MDDSVDRGGLGPAGEAARVEASLRLALDASKMGLWDWDVVSGLLIWDERSAQMYGTTLEASTGSIADVDARVHPDDLEHVRAALAGAIDSVGAVDVEFRVVWPDGSVHWLYGRGQALAGPSGVVERLIGVNADVTGVRSEARERAADVARMVGLVAVAQALGSADTEQEVLDVVSGRGMAVMGAQGAALALVEQDGAVVRTLATSYFEDQVIAQVAELPPTYPLPIVDTAVSGTPWFLRDRAEGVAAFPSSEALYVEAATEGSATVPLLDRGQLIGALAVTFAAPHDWRPADRALLEALAALTAQAVARVRAVAAERISLQAIRKLLETLQRSLLTEPTVTAGLEVVVRYLPAAEEAQVGGDWYDAFSTPDCGLTLVVGDVAGHDRAAAAQMAQVRNVLRGVAQVVGEPPARVLSALDQAMRGLELDALASAVLCTVDPDDESGVVLRWCNAGHPPPLLLPPSGPARLLHTDPELLLGLDPSTSRTDHRVVLEPGSFVVLYTDGLVERRDEHLDTSLARLADLVTDLAPGSAHELADALLARLGDARDDDVALLVLEVPARPAESSVSEP